MTRCTVSVFAEDSDRTAKIASISFYKQLRKAGFSPEQILAIASDITERLSSTVERFRDKVASERVAPSYAAEVAAIH